VQREQIWIGLAAMERLKAGKSGVIKGGFVTVIGRASSKYTFRKKVKASLSWKKWKSLKFGLRDCVWIQS
jgi:hypothetical protein